MAWAIDFLPGASRQLRKLDRKSRTQFSIIWRMWRRCPIPRLRGKIPTGDRQGLWRYRVGDYRAICQIEDHRLTVLVLEIGHRKEIYR